MNKSNKVNNMNRTELKLKVRELVGHNKFVLLHEEPGNGVTITSPQTIEEAAKIVAGTLQCMIKEGVVKEWEI